MAKGKRRPIVKRKFRAPPAVIADEGADFSDFSDLREDYKALRRRFVQEYIKDFNGTQAILRLGYKYGRATAQTKASQWLAESYTQHALAEVMEKLDERAIVSRNEVLLGLKREAHEAFNSGAERVSALRTLAKILGMEITKIEGNMTIGGGVMTIPLAGTPDQWEKAAAEAQERLKAQVRV